MHKRWAVCGAIMVLVAASPVSAGCSVSSDDGAIAKPIDITAQSDANIVVSMSMLPKLMHIDYASASGKRPSCDLGQFTAGDASYELYGDDKAGRQRIAEPARKGDPVAQVVPVIDILEAISASKQGQPAPLKGYLLATVTKTDFTGWRFYTGMPDPAVLKRDMAEALSGTATPIFRNGRDGKTTISGPTE